MDIDGPSTEEQSIQESAQDNAIEADILETDEQVDNLEQIDVDAGTSSSAELPNVVIDSVEDECKSPSRPRPSKEQKLSTSAEKRKRRRSVEEDEADGSSCSICLECWSNSGEHRLASLKCGHLFGRSCIVRWLRSQQTTDKCCPTCKTKASIKDIRCIYAKKLVAVDTSEIEAMKKVVDEATADKNRAELMLQKSLMNQKLYLKQLADLREILKQFEGEIQAKTTNNRHVADNKKWRLAMEKNMELGRDADCRVMTFNCRKYEMCISSKSANALFPGYGVKKVNCLDFKYGSYIYLHTKAIRDLCYSQPNDLILSVSLDKSAKLVSGQNNNIVCNVGSEIPLWSCCWDYFIPQKFYIGGPGGVCYQYDMRQPSNYLEKFHLPSDVSPVISLTATPDGFISCHLNSCWFYSRDNDGIFRPVPLPIQGPFSSLTYDANSKHILVSTRPSQQYVQARHVLCDLSISKEGAAVFNAVHTFLGSTVQTVMSRTSLLNLENECWVSAYSENEAAISMYSVNSMSRVQSLKSHENTILDLCPLGFNGGRFLAALSQNRLKIYKAVVSDS